MKPADLEIHEIYRRYCAQPVYVIVDVQPKDMVVPTEAYFSFEEPTSDKSFRRTFVHVPATIGAYEAEEVGVEHLLRDLKNASTSTLATQVGDKLISLRHLIEKLRGISKYLQEVATGALPINPRIVYNLQNIFNLLPDVEREERAKEFMVQTNDMMLAVYVGSMVRSVLALHNLINNKVANKCLTDAKSKVATGGEAGEKDGESKGTSAKAQGGEKEKAQQKNTPEEPKSDSK
eukprot:GHVT01064668.1.p1 GENE.GHVT01064668.1~~GHVT01064668.1.p1  ORF type:complete len:234 (+),score=56.60 GHVT01064668.1:493-1194(+)